MSYCRWTDGDVYAYESDYGVQFWIAGNKSLDRVCRTHIEAYQYAKELRDVHGVSIPDYAIETLREESVDERERLLGILETIANVIERDYVRRESIEEVMDNDRALVEENSMLAGELLKMRAELEKATNNLNSANKDFENARAELVAECDELKELNEYHALQYELASEDADRLQAQVDRLTAERDNWKANCEDWKKDCERYRNKFGKCLDYADAIHDLMDEGMA